MQPEVDSTCAESGFISLGKDCIMSAIHATGMRCTLCNWPDEVPPLLSPRC